MVDPGVKIGQGKEDVLRREPLREGAIGPVPRISAEIARLSAREGLQSDDDRA